LNFYFYFHTGVKKAKPKKIKKKDDLGALLTEGLAKAPKVRSYICRFSTYSHKHITNHLDFLPLPPFSQKTKAEKEKEARLKAKEEARKKQLEDEEAARENKEKDPYARAPLVENMNHAQPLEDGISDEIIATGIDSALEALSMSGVGSGGGGGVVGGGDAHPEKRRKAAYLAFETAMLPSMREEYPGLKLQQYKQKIFKLWEKSPENPMNQVASNN
jgi:hypothetical protein